jgi:hypothetical protein
MNNALIFLAIVLAGCAVKPDAKPWTKPAAWTPDSKTTVTVSSYPDDAENSLTQTQKTELAKLRATSHPIPSTSSFQTEPSLRSVYLDWYAKGYTFTAAIGLETIRPQTWVVDSPEQRAKKAGWQDGQFDAHLKRIEESLEKLRGQKSGAANAATPHR